MDIHTYSDSDLGFSYNRLTATTVGDVEEDIVYATPSSYLSSDYIEFDTACSRLELYVSLQQLKRTYHSDTQTYDEETTDINGTCYIRWYYMSGGSYFYLGSTNYGLLKTNKIAEKSVSDVPIMANATHFRVYINCGGVYNSAGAIPPPPTGGTWSYLQEAIATVKIEYWYTNADNPDVLTSDMGVPQPPSIMMSSMPLAEWRIKKETVTHELLPTYKLLLDGAFKNAQNLSVVRVPSTVLKIGEYAFFDTNISRVVLNKNCVFNKKAFPSGTKIFYYIE